MATSVVVLSDLSGEPGATTRRVTVGSTSYEVDMTDSEFNDYETVLAPYVAVGRKVVNPSGFSGEVPLRRRTGRRSSVETAAIKSWGRQNGFQFKDKGRLPQVLLDAYQAAHTR